MAIRKASLEDLDAIEQIEQEAMSTPWSRQSFETAITAAHTIFLVAEDGTSVIGFAVLYLTPPEAELPDIVVASGYRGHGVGRELLTQLFVEARSHSVENIFLEVRISNAAAIQLYTGFGFEQIGTRKNFYSKPTEDALLMRACIGGLKG